MAEDRVDRRLAAIMAADVVGYSRLMEADEEGTHARLRSLHHDLIAPLIAADGGRIVKTMGDGILAEFPSAVNAVRNALAIQNAIVRRTAEFTEGARLELRIGINVGDIIIEGDDIYGDGVNVAARLEGLCEPGEVYVSGTVFDQSAGKLAASFDELGERTVKNIAKPVRIYRARPTSNVQAGEENHTADAMLSLPDKPSIAVLPFTNMSGDEEQEYFADGIAEDIITGLSKFQWFFVIARNSSFSYKGTSPDVRQVAKDLGVQYVLEGSVRKGGNRVRVTAQLIDALTGRHIWAERYDGDLDDIFAVQDEITQAIVSAVAPSFISAEAKRVESKTPESLDVWDYCMRGNWYLSHRSEEDIAEARRMFEKALELNPNSSMALSGLAITLGWMINFGWGEDRNEIRSTAFSVARRVVELDSNDADAHVALGVANFYSDELDAAIASNRRALELNPNLALAHGWLSASLGWAGDYDAAIHHAKETQRLSPRDIYSIGNFARTIAEYGAGNYDKAIEWAKKTIEVTPKFPAGWMYLTFSLGNLDRLQEAKVAGEQVRRLIPHITLGALREALPSKKSEEIDRRIDGLRKAGIPE